MGSGVQVSSMLRSCSAPGCSTMTLGRFCVAHEPVLLARQFVRGRPFVRAATELAELPAQLLGAARKLPV